MTFENVLFVFTISFQLAAALLLVNNVATSKKGIIKAYCAQHTAIAFEDTDKTLADYSSLKMTIRNAWINKFAFMYLFVGYLVSIWGEVPSNKCLALLFVLLLIGIFIAIPLIVAKYKSEHFGIVTENDIPKKDGVFFVEV